MIEFSSVHVFIFLCTFLIYHYLEGRLFCGEKMVAVDVWLYGCDDEWLNYFVHVWP